MMFLTYKGRLPHYVTRMEIGVPYKAATTWGTVQVPGRPGVLLTDKISEPISIPVKFLVEGADREEYLRNIEDLADWLEAEEPQPLVFSENPYRTYFAVVQGDVKPEEENNIYGVVDIDFFVPDGVKYGPEKLSPFVNGVANIQNRGSKKVKPVIYAQALGDLTHLDILSESKYMRIGQPADLGTVAANPETLLLNNQMNTLTGWTTTGVSIDNGNVTGSFTFLDGTFKGVHNATGQNAWHGPAAKIAIPGAPLTDFVVEQHVRLPNLTRASDGMLGFGRAETYLIASDGSHMGKITMRRTNMEGGNICEIRIGGGAQFTFLMNYGGKNGREYNAFNGIVRIARRGNVWTGYVAQVHPTTGKHSYPFHTKFVDEQLLYTKTLGTAQIHLGGYAQRPIPDARFWHLKVWRVNQIPDKDPRIIAKMDDLIEIDFVNSAIYINGEERRDLKDLGANFFHLPRGDSQLAIDPPSLVNAVTNIREVFL